MVLLRHSAACVIAALVTAARLEAAAKSVNSPAEVPGPSPSPRPIDVCAAQGRAASLQQTMESPGVQPRISVITASFNASATIGDTLASVARQTDVDYEHIVVDGASRDDTMEVVQRHNHPRLSAVSEPDKGIYDAMNKGIARATGDYLLFLNADDYLARPDSLKLAADAIARSGTDCLFADTRFVAGEGRQPRRQLYSARRFSPWWLRIGAMPPHPSMFLRRSLMEELGGYDTSYRIAGDFDFISRAILQHHATYATLPMVLTHFRVGGVSTSGLQSKLTLSREMARSLQHLGQPFSHTAVLLRFPLKMAQFAIFQRKARPLDPPSLPDGQAPLIRRPNRS